MECFRSVLAPVKCDESQLSSVKPLIFLQYLATYAPGMDMSFDEALQFFRDAREVVTQS